MARIEELEARMLRVERWVGLERPTEPSSPPPPPPPVINVRPQLMFSPQAAEKSASETEYLLGAKVFPWVGAALVLIATLYFIFWGYTKGLITEGMLFGGELLVSASFVCVGIWRRRDREEFGHLLTGIGVCAMYFSLVGGHLVHKILTGEALVVGFALWSLAVLAYSVTIRARTFFWLGTAGGLIGAMLPLGKDAVTVSMALYGLIGLSATATLLKQKWAESSVVFWMAGLASLVPFLASPATTDAQKLSLWYLFSIFGLVSSVRNDAPNTLDPRGTGLQILAFLSPILALAINNQAWSPLHVLGWAALVGCASLIENGQRKLYLRECGLGIAAFVAPMGLTALNAAFAYVALAAIATVRIQDRRLWLAGVGLLSCSGMGYLVAVSMHSLAWTTESALLGLMALVGTALTYTANENREGAWAVGSTFVLTCLTRLAWVYGDHSGHLISKSTAALTVLLLASVALSILGQKLNSRSLATIGYLSVVTACLAFGVDVLDRSFGSNDELAKPGNAVVAAMLLSTLLSVAAITHRTLRNSTAVVFLALLGWPMAAFFAMCLTRSESMAASIASALYGLAVLGLGFWSADRPVRFTAMAILGITVGKVILVDLADRDTITRVAVAFALGLCMLLAGYAYVRRGLKD